MQGVAALYQGSGSRIRGMQERVPNTHQPKMPHSVTLSAAKGLSRWAARCFAEFTLSAANGLSMTAVSRLLPPRVSPRAQRRVSSSLPMVMITRLPHAARVLASAQSQHGQSTASDAMDGSGAGFGRGRSRAVGDDGAAHLVLECTFNRSSSF